MNTVELTTADPGLKDNLDFLIKLEFKRQYRRNKIRIYWLSGLTLFYMVVAILPNTDGNIPVKGVATMIFWLMWLAALFISVTILTKYNRRKRWRRATVSEAFINTHAFSFSWDDERMTYRTAKYETTMKWSMFKYFIENKNTLYIFNERNIYEALFLTKNELGHDNYENLKEIVSTKLTLLPNTNGT